MRTDLRKPCNDCPFRRNSLAGWLGPWSAPDLLFSLGRTPFPCHQTIKHDAHDYGDAALQGCAGAAIFLNNKCERSRAPETDAHQEAVRNVPPDVKVSVFQWSQEFLDHHASARKATK